MFNQVEDEEKKHGWGCDSSVLILLEQSLTVKVTLACNWSGFGWMIQTIKEVLIKGIKKDYHLPIDPVNQSLLSYLAFWFLIIWRAPVILKHELENSLDSILFFSFFYFFIYWLTQWLLFAIFLFFSSSFYFFIIGLTIHLVNLLHFFNLLMKVWVN